MKRLALISGGGSYGAWSAGLFSQLQKDYDVVAGVSTGALQSPLVALKKYDKLKEAYTNVNDGSIYNIKPFNKHGKLDLFNVVRRFIRNMFKSTSTLGESLPLRDLIDKFLTYEDWLELNAGHKEIIVSALETMHEPALTCYFSSREWSLDDFKDWMWASANAPVLFSILYKDAPNLGYRTGEWTDAGLTEFIPRNVVQQFDEIDVIIHRHYIDSKAPLVKKGPITDPTHAIARYVDIMRHKLEHKVIDDLIAGAADAQSRINLFYMPKEVQGNSLAFNKQVMTNWYDLGATQKPIEVSFDFSKQK